MQTSRLIKGLVPDFGFALNVVQAMKENTVVNVELKSRLGEKR